MVRCMKRSVVKLVSVLLFIRFFVSLFLCGPPEATPPPRDALPTSRVPSHSPALGETGRERRVFVGLRGKKGENRDDST